MKITLKIYLFLTFILFCLNFTINVFAEQDNPKISVIIPVYNTEKYLPDCLECIKNQTLNDIEFIFIDDGSTDKSLEILENHAKQNNKAIILKQQNQGAASARNKGLDVAKGEYISFVDSDDTFEPDIFKISLEEAKKDNADILVFSSDTLKVKNNIYKDPLKILKRNSFLPPWNKIYRREFLKGNNIKFYEKAKCFNDFCFNAIAIPKAKIIKTIKQEFYHYRIHENSITTKTSKKQKLETTFLCAKYIEENYKKNNYNIHFQNWLKEKIKNKIEKYTEKYKNT